MEEKRSAVLSFCGRRDAGISDSPDGVKIAAHASMQH